jgi:hypothetical protein
VSDYDFKGLSPIDFETFARDLLSASEGLSFTTFRVGRDGGVDLEATMADGSRLVAQCKHTPSATRSVTLRAIAKEQKKWVKQTLPSRYMWVTSADLSHQTHLDMPAKAHPLPLNVSDIWGKGRLNEVLSQPDCRHVERRHYKLWLESSEAMRQVLDASAWSRGDVLRRRIKRNLSVYVDHPSYDAAAEKLDRERMCLLAGGPGVGKTTLAEVILLRYAESGYRVFVLDDNMSEAFRYLDMDENVFFYYDDFVGQTDAAEFRSRGEVSGLAELIAEVRASSGDGHQRRLLLTSRDQVFQQAMSISDALRHLNLTPARFQVTVKNLSPIVKSRIIYNHLYASNMPRVERVKLAKQTPQLMAACHHPNFSPRLVSLVVQRSATSAATLMDDLLRTLEDPADIWQGSFHNLSMAARRLLLALATMPSEGCEESLLRLTAGIETADLPLATDETAGSWIAVIRQHGNRFWRFADPSCRDFAFNYIQRNPGLISDIIQRVQTLDHMLLLLEYGRDPQTFDYSLFDETTHPAIGEQLLKNMEVVRDRVQALTERELQSTNLPKYRNSLTAQRFKILDRALRGLDIMGGLESWDDRSADWLSAEVRSCINKMKVGDPGQPLFYFVRSLLGLSSSGNRLMRPRPVSIAKILRSPAYELFGRFVPLVSDEDDLLAVMHISEQASFEINRDRLKALANDLVHEIFDSAENEESEWEIDEAIEKIRDITDFFDLDMDLEIEELEERKRTLAEEDENREGTPAPVAPSGSRREVPALSGLTDTEFMTEMFLRFGTDEDEG